MRATALDWGLVNRVVPEAGLDAEVKRFTDVIAARSPAVVALGKRAFYQQIDRGLAGAYESGRRGDGLQPAGTRRRRRHRRVPRQAPAALAAT